MKNLFSEVRNPLVSKICSVAQPLVYIPKVESVGWSVTICLLLKLLRF